MMQARLLLPVKSSKYICDLRGIFLSYVQFTTSMNALFGLKDLTSIFAGFLSLAVVGVSIELHHCHGMGGTFSTTACEMSTKQACAMHNSTASLSTQEVCCERHTFSLTSGDPFAPSVQKYNQSQLSKILLLALPRLQAREIPCEFSSVPHLQIHSPPPGRGQDIYLLDSALLI